MERAPIGPYGEEGPYERGDHTDKAPNPPSAMHPSQFLVTTAIDAFI